MPTWVLTLPAFAPPDCEHRVDGNIAIARSFLRLATLDGGAFERLNRYEIGL